MAVFEESGSEVCSQAENHRSWNLPADAPELPQQSFPSQTEPPEHMGHRFIRVDVDFDFR
jgi:hypothetical protein